MRERVTESPLVESGLHVYTRNYYYNTTQDCGWSYWKHRPEYERIVDEPKTAYVEYRKGMRRRAFRTVTHDRWRSSAPSPPSWVWNGLSGTQNGAAFVSACELIAAHHECSYPADLAAAAYSAAVSKGLAEDYGHYNRWSQLKPSMATRANLSVFLYELRDIKRMWDILPGKHFRLADWRSVLHYANGQHLNYNFGWKPFLSDIRKTWKAADTFEKRLDRFVNNADKELRRRFRDTSRAVELTEYSTFFENSFWRHERKWSFTEQHASAFDYSYSIPQYGRDELRWRAWLDSLGLKVTPANIWAVLPWSFVVDWFIDVGGFLEQASSDWLAPWIRLHQGCYSRHMEGTFQWNVKSPDAYGGVVLPGISMNFSQYIRRVGLPNFSAVTDPLDADKIRLGTSLLLSLFRK